MQSTSNDLVLIILMIQFTVHEKHCKMMDMIKKRKKKKKYCCIQPFSWTNYKMF